jgi:hypothetical protein
MTENTTGGKEADAVIALWSSLTPMEKKEKL